MPNGTLLISRYKIKNSKFKETTLFKLLHSIAKQLTEISLDKDAHFYDDISMIYLWNNMELILKEIKNIPELLKKSVELSITFGSLNYPTTNWNLDINSKEIDYHTYEETTNKTYNNKWETVKVNSSIT